MIKYSISVPRGIVINTNYHELYEKIMKCGRKDALLSFRKRFTENLNQQIEESNLSGMLIFRSSANIEGDSISCSGIFDSYIYDNSKDNCFDIAQKVWDSSHNKEALLYFSKLKKAPNIKMAVLIQPICSGEICGVVHTYDIINNKNCISIEYSDWRIEAVVDGKDIVKRIIKLREGNTFEGDWPFHENIINDLCNTSLRIESILGGYCEIEFIVSDGKVHILQARLL